MRKRARSSCEKLRKARQNHEISGSVFFHPPSLSVSIRSAEGTHCVAFLSSSTSTVVMPEMSTKSQLRHSTRLTLQLVGLKDLNQLPRNNIVKAVEERLDLVLYRVVQAVGHHEPDVFLLVLLGDRDLGAALLELDDLLLAKLLVFNGEFLLKQCQRGDAGCVVTHVDDTGDIIVQHPLERLVVLWVDRLEVAHVNRPPEDLLVKGAVKVRVEKSVAANGQGEDDLGLGGLTR